MNHLSPGVLNVLLADVQMHTLFRSTAASVIGI